MANGVLVFGFNVTILYGGNRAYDHPLSAWQMAIVLLSILAAVVRGRWVWREVETRARLSLAHIVIVHCFAEEHLNIALGPCF
jgi:hypothetical protein